MFQVTIKELSERLGIEYQAAQGLVKFLVLMGEAKIIKVRPNPNGKGKGSNVYELPESVTINLRERPKS